MTLSERIRQARESLSAVEGEDVTQEELARRCGWINGQTRISNYETGHRRPRADAVMALARATGVRVEWLQYEKGPMSDDSAALALALSEPGPGAMANAAPEMPPVSPPLRRLMLKLMALEQDGALNETATRSLTRFLDSLTDARTRT